MSTKYYIAADGGGSKLLAILYDENFNIIRHCKLSGVNSNFKPVEAVRANISQMIDLLLADDVKEVEAADVCFVESPSVWTPILKGEPRIKSTENRGEPRMALAAALMNDGIVTISGTGSDAFFIKEGRVLGGVGGWGALFGDEGSGYDIGLRSVKAALLDNDGRGESTALKKLIFDAWKTNNFWDIIMGYGTDPDYRHKIAAVAKLTAEAANAGDKVARDIYTYAADELAAQTLSLLRRFPETQNGNVVIAGGAWKGYHGMFEHYKSELERIYPSVSVQEPIFEPVIGCAVCRIFDSTDRISDEIKEKLVNGFSEFLYRKK